MQTKKKKKNRQLHRHSIKLKFTKFQELMVSHNKQKPENPGKNHLTICKQNLALPHVTRARLEPQKWET